MWIALHLTALQWCLVAVGLGLTEGVDEGCPSSPARGGRPGWMERWTLLGVAAQAGALAALAGGWGDLDRASLVWLACGGGLMTFYWIGAAARRRALARSGRSMRVLPWKATLAACEALLVGLTAWRLGVHFSQRPAPAAFQVWGGASSTALGVYCGGALLLVVMGALRGLARAGPGLTARQAGLAPRLLGLGLMVGLIWRAVAIYFSLWVGLAGNPIGERFFLHALIRGGGETLYLRWMLGLLLPGGIALTLLIDPPDASVRMVRFQLTPLLLLVILGEILGGALVAGTGGLAL